MFKKTGRMTIIPCPADSKGSSLYIPTTFFTPPVIIFQNDNFYLLEYHDPHFLSFCPPHYESIMPYNVFKEKIKI